MATSEKGPSWDVMPGYGIVAPQQLIEAVAEASIGDRNFPLRGLDPERSIGHQIVPTINFNSLNRIVSAFILAERKRAGFPISN